MNKEKKSKLKKSRFLLAVLAVVLVVAIYLLFFAEYSADTATTTTTAVPAATTTTDKTAASTTVAPDSATKMASLKKGFGTTMDLYLPKSVEPAVIKSLVLQNEANTKVTVKVALKGVECIKGTAKKRGGCLYEYKPNPDTMTFNLDSNDTGEIKIDFNVVRVDQVVTSRGLKAKKTYVSDFGLSKKIDNKDIIVKSIAVTSLDGQKIISKSLNNVLKPINSNFKEYKKVNLFSVIPPKVQKYQITTTSPVKFKITPAATTATTPATTTTTQTTAK